ncbi:MAG: hypothetical protein QW303_07455 [Nitrososphaerota archaeon]
MDATKYRFSNVIIPLIVITVFIIFIDSMLYLLVSSNFKTNQTRLSCLPGQCATNLQNGFKSCPVDIQEVITIDPLKEVCNSASICDNPLTPYAVQSDGSTDFNGVCESGIKCPCVRFGQCSNYILSAFKVDNGIPYQSITSQRITFSQSSILLNTSDTPPIQFSDIGNTFCSIPFSWLALSKPGCNFINASNISYSDVLACMGMPNGCNNFLGNPCLRGTLAFLSSDSSSMTQGDIFNTPVACVRGKPCPCNQVAIFDTNLNAIVCRELK